RRLTAAGVVVFAVAEHHVNRPRLEIGHVVWPDAIKSPPNIAAVKMRGLLRGEDSRPNLLQIGIAGLQNEYDHLNGVGVLIEPPINDRPPKTRVLRRKLIASDQLEGRRKRPGGRG